MKDFHPPSKVMRSIFHKAVSITVASLIIITAIAASNISSMASAQMAPGNPAIGTNATTTTGAQTSSVCLPQGQNATTTITTPNAATTTPSGAGGGGNTTTAGGGGGGRGGNATTTTAASQAIDETRFHIEEGCRAINNNDTQGALMHLNLALRSLDNIQGNLTTTAGANQENQTGGGLLGELGDLFQGR